MSELYKRTRDTRRGVTRAVIKTCVNSLGRLALPWSRVNIDKIEALMKQGLVHEKGKLAYAAIDENNSEKASYEQKDVLLPKKYVDSIKENINAWIYYNSMTAYVKRASNWYILSAKREETRLKRLNTLIESSENNLKIPQLRKIGK